MQTREEDIDVLDEVMPCWILRRVNDSALLAGQANERFPVSSWASVRPSICWVSKTCNLSKIKPGIVKILLATKVGGPRQIVFFWAIIP